MSYQHTEVTGRTGQNVRMAAKLLSNRTAQAVEYLLEDTEAIPGVEFFFFLSTLPFKFLMYAYFN